MRFVQTFIENKSEIHSLELDREGGRKDREGGRKDREFV